MSNVRIEAGEIGLEVDVVLGANCRKTHEVPGGEGIELTVGGGQTLTIRAASNVAPEAEAALPEGADVPEQPVEAEDAPIQEDMFGGAVFPVADPADQPT